ncbi:unnamed protein product [Eruca vesicaria subsp. sativa]|uniref:DUF3444 domain-containing protein n=1 Tax=Eruca vesicaria subsp. sativa TaxID=29727 RepID=A0ABC8LDB0_ERUVS|nr:unnamed protein product [Eruca vesicaria subsp. sativa]
MMKRKISENFQNSNAKEKWKLAGSFLFTGLVGLKVIPRRQVSSVSSMITFASSLAGDTHRQSDSHRKYEYDFVETLSDYSDGAGGVFVRFLHKAKGFASVFFRMGTGEADTFHISTHSLYRFSHRIPSFKLNGIKGKGVPKCAYELDQAALPENILEVTVPSHLLAKPAAPNPETEELTFPISGKVFQTGQIWSYTGYFDNMPRDYCRIYKISLTQAFEQAPVYKIHAFWCKATPLPKDIIPSV